MDFRIADTFTGSLARLTGDEQKSVKTTAFDLQMNPVNPGMQFHRIDKSKDKNFWSVRVGADIRIIVHKTSNSLLLCYVGHHDAAYDWAERRRLDTHPKTGAAQLVEIRETVQDIVVPNYVAEPPPITFAKPLFGQVSDDELLGYGVPPDWLQDVRDATEDTLLMLADHLPAEAAEALVELATGGNPRTRSTAVAEKNIFYQSAALPAARSSDEFVLRDSASIAHVSDPFAHPDAQRRFRLMSNVEELERALDFPWDKWTVFLHPEQRELVERDYSGPARVSGSAGTGKTIVALHRAVYLARHNPESRVLLTTFSEALANALRTRLRRLLSNEPRLAERLEVHAMDAIGQRLYERHFGRPQLVSREHVRKIIAESATSAAVQKFKPGFLYAEWEELVDAWQLENWESYRDFNRLGRKTRLPEAQRAALWAVFDDVKNIVLKQNLITFSEMYTRLAQELTVRKHPAFDYVVVDEAQDVSVSQLRFLAALAADRPNGLFFSGDLGQRIFQVPFSWSSQGVDVRGRARTLHVNYRTSHQIRMQADRLLAPEVADVDGNTEDRCGTVSVFNGPVPLMQTFDIPDAEIEAVAAWLVKRSKDGIAPHEIGVFVRSEAELPRARAAVTNAALPFRVLDDHVETTSGQVSVCTMHLAKGLEFRAVAVMACDDEVIPLQARIESVVDESDLEEVYNTERHLLYVACTRARDHLLVSSVKPASEFLDDLNIKDKA